MQENEAAKLIVGLAFRVHSRVGPGLFESAYERALAHELTRSGCRFDRQVAVPFIYDGVSLGPGFRADFIVENVLLVEIKSVKELASVHRKQVITYLRLTELRLGLLINFGAEVLRKGITRVVNGLPD